METGGMLAEQKLWIAVILEMMKDIKAAPNKDYNSRELNRTYASRWFGSEGFREVCALAGLEPDYVLRIVISAKNEGRLDYDARPIYLRARRTSRHIKE